MVSPFMLASNPVPDMNHNSPDLGTQIRLSLRSSRSSLGDRQRVFARPLHVFQVRFRIRSAPFSAIMIVGALVLPLTIDGMIEASQMLKPSMP
jgi:hypothetical protein